MKEQDTLTNKLKPVTYGRIGKPVRLETMTPDDMLKAIEQAHKLVMTTPPRTGLDDAIAHLESLREQQLRMAELSVRCLTVGESP